MKLPVIIDNIIYNLQKSGGISVVWYEITRRLLKDRSLEFRFIEYNSSYNIFRRLLKIPKENVYWQKSRFGIKIFRYFDLRCSKMSSPFIFHSSYYRISSNPMAINITTVHDFTYEYYSKGLGKYIHCWQKHRAIRKSDYVVCISENTKLDLLKFIPEYPEERIRVIYNGVSNDYYPLDDNTLDHFDKKNILFVGIRAGYKNFDFLVTSLVNTDYCLEIVGPQLSKSEITLLNTYIPDRWEYLGRLSNYELNERYNKSFALVYPSLYEGFGIPILEAQKAGCPVIACSSSSIPEIAGEGALLIETMSKDELIRKLLILENPMERRIIKQKGIENAAKYSWDKTYNEIVSLYNEIAKVI